MKKSFLILLFLIMVPFSFGIEEGSWMYNSEYLVLDTQIYGYLELVREGDSPFVEFIQSELSFYPKITEFQEILKEDHNPIPGKVNESLLFRWDNPDFGMHDMNLNYVIKVSSNPKRINDKIKFPIEEMPLNIKIFTEPAEIIDINKDIIALASTLAEGEDDLVVVVDNIAHWVTANIQYNLSTATSEASQKASWVLKNKNGVCDELTSLFIAMLRSLKIPSRFVAGISYTESEYFDEPWGAHGWAEVYFPGYGWVPYDVTYGQYGFVDPTHIVARYSADAEKISSKYSWKGRDIDVRVHDLNTNVKLISSGSEKLPAINIDINPFKGSVGFDSYNFVEAKVTNLGGYYQPIDVKISRTTDLNVINEKKQHILLKPFEEKKIFWKLKVSGDLDKDYMYTFPIVVYTIGNISDKSEFHSANGGIYLSEDKIDNEISKLNGGIRKKSEIDLSLNCNLNKREFYKYEKPRLICDFVNTGKKLITKLNVCIENSCSEENIGITQKVSKEYEHSIKKNINEIKVFAKNDEINKSEIISFLLMDEPIIEVSEIEFPKIVRYDEEYVFSFILKKESSSNPQKVKTSFMLQGLESSFYLDKMEFDQKYEIKLNGNDLLNKDNTAEIIIDYSDKNGKEYSVYETSVIKRDELTFFQSFEVGFKRLIKKIMNLF